MKEIENLLKRKDRMINAIKDRAKPNKIVEILSLTKV